ncbi:hypothetical protein [Micropruina sp.]|uniref:hypothetical protein n=1 Tax=Micropruina sp. TaxID=2737536 RepID=UPI0039E3294F
MTDHPDPLANPRGFAALNTRGVSEQFARRLRNPHWEMADNALRKARRVLADDPARAQHYVDLALRLPYDEFEKQASAGVEAHLMLYSLVTDAAEESDQNDPAWLDAAIDAMRVSERAGQAETRVVLEIVDDDFQLPSAEQRKPRRAVSEVEPTLTLHDADFPIESMSDRIMAVPELWNRCEETLDQHYA